MPESRLLIEILAKDLASGQLAQVATRLDEMGRAAQRSVKSIEEIGNRLQALGKTLSTLGAAITAATVGLVVVGKNAASQLSDLALSAGMAASQFAKLSNALSQWGIRAEDVASIASRFKRHIAEIAMPREKATRPSALALLGFTEEQVRAYGNNVAALMLEASRRLQAIQDETLRTVLEYELFGRAEIAGRLARIPLPELTRAMALAPPVTDEMIEKADALDDALTRLRNSFSALGISVAAALAPHLIPLIDALTNLLNQLSQLVATPVGKVLASLTLAFGGLLTVIGSLVSKFGMLIIALKGIGGLSAIASGLASAFAMVKAALAGIVAIVGAISTPVLIVIGVIAALAAIVYLLVRYWDTVKSALAAAWDWIKRAASALIDWFKKNWWMLSPFGWIYYSITVLLPRILPKLIEFGRKMIEFLRSLGRRMLQAVIEGLRGLAEAIIAPFRKAWQWIASRFKFHSPPLDPALRTLYATFQNIPVGLGEAMKQRMSALQASLSDAFRGLTPVAATAMARPRAYAYTITVVTDREIDNRVRTTIERKLPEILRPLATGRA